MKKLLNTAFIYALAAMAGGVFYREFTKFNGFSGRTALGLVHTHLFLLGTVFFLLAALFSKELDWARERNFRLFYGLYNTGLCVTAVMLAVRGAAQVLALPLSRGMDAAISGVAGLGHICLGAGLVVFFLSLKKTACTANVQKLALKNKSQRFSLRRTLAFLFSFFIGTPRKIIQGYPVKIGQRHQRVDGNRDTAQFIL